MSAIDALRRQETSAVTARPEANRSSRRFGEDLADAVDRTGERDDPIEGSTGDAATATDPTTSPEAAPTSAEAPVGVSSGGTAMPIAAVPAETVPSTGVVEVGGGPRINNGGSCSCCTPGVLRVVADEVAGIPAGPPADAFDAALPPPATPPVLAPPSGPPAPLGPPAQPLPPPLPGAVPSPVAGGAIDGSEAIDLLQPTQRETSESSGAPAPDKTVPAPAATAFADPASVAPVLVTAAPVTEPIAMPARTTPAPAPAPAAAVVVPGGAAIVAPALDPGSTAADTGTDDDAPTDDAGASAPTSRSLSAADLSAPTTASTTTSGPTASTGSSPLTGPSVSEGVLRSEQVRVMRELAPNREVQRLAFELDGARVAVRFDQDGAKVNVVADPGNRLGSDWANNVQRTLDAGARQGSTFQQRDADGGRRNRQGHDRTPAVDELTAADFAARLGATERT